MANHFSTPDKLFTSFSLFILDSESVCSFSTLCCSSLWTLCAKCLAGSFILFSSIRVSLSAILTGPCRTFAVAIPPMAPLRSHLLTSPLAFSFVHLFGVRCSLESIPVVLLGFEFRPLSLLQDKICPLFCLVLKSSGCH